MFYSNITASASSEKRRIACTLCGHVNELSKISVSATCSHCRKAMKLDEVRIKDYQSRRNVETCDSLVIERNGSLKADKVVCKDAIIRGKSNAEVIARGTVQVGPEAQMAGKLTAPAVVIPEGVIIEGFFSIGPGAILADPAPDKTDENSKAA
jgi:hypothetical protein